MFAFQVDDVPDADFYEVEVSHRGGLTWPQEELDDEGWDVCPSVPRPAVPARFRVLRTGVRPVGTLGAARMSGTGRGTTKCKHGGSTMTRMATPARRSWAVATALLLAAAAAGCGSGTMNTGEWTETVMARDLQGYTDALDRAMDNVPAGATAPTEEACSVMSDWADQARSEPMPANDAIAEAWGNFIDAGDAFGTEACPSGDVDVLLEQQGKVQDAIAALESAIRDA